MPLGGLPVGLLALADRRHRLVHGAGGESKRAGKAALDDATMAKAVAHIGERGAGFSGESVGEVQESG